MLIFISMTLHENRHAELVSASGATKEWRLQNGLADADIHQHDAVRFIKAKNL